MPIPRIIRLNRTSIALTAQNILPLSTTSLPAGIAAELLRIDQTLYWEVIGSYEPTTQTATLRVVDFIPDYERIKTFRTEATTSLVQYVQFEPFDEVLYQQWVARYQSPANRPRPSAHTPEDNFTTADERYGPIFQPYPQHSQTWTTNFRYPFAAAEFEHGALAGVWAKLPKGWAPVTFRINNTHLRVEFSYLRELLIRKLGRQTFDVHLAVTTHPDGRIETEATSAHIDQIDETMVKSLRTERAQRVQNGKFQPKNDAPVLTLAEVIEQLREPSETTDLLTVEELKRFLTEGARNQAQIEYLAEQHDLSVAVRFTCGYYVGFIFSVAGTSFRHYCWELLDSNATYVWSLPLDIDDLEAAALLEHQLLAINQLGRTEYRRHYTEQLPAAWRFKWIEHALLNRTPEATFQVWQGELGRLLT